MKVKQFINECEKREYVQCLYHETQDIIFFDTKHNNVLSKIRQLTKNSDTYEFSVLDTRQSPANYVIINKYEFLDNLKKTLKTTEKNGHFSFNEVCKGVSHVDSDLQKFLEDNGFEFKYHCGWYTVINHNLINERLEREKLEEMEIDNFIDEFEKDIELKEDKIIINVVVNF